MKTGIAVALAGALLLPLRASAAPLDELNRFVGTWQSQGTFVDSPYQKAGSATATTTCAWSSDHVFLICQQSVVMEGKADSDLGIYTYDATQNTYRFYSLRTGQVTASAITIDGNTVTYPISFNDKGKAVTIRTLNIFDSPTLYHWRTEYSADGGTSWTPMASGVSKKQ